MREQAVRRILRYPTRNILMMNVVRSKLSLSKRSSFSHQLSRVEVFERRLIVRISHEHSFVSLGRGLLERQSD